MIGIFFTGRALAQIPIRKRAVSANWRSFLHGRLSAIREDAANAQRSNLTAKIQNKNKYSKIRVFKTKFPKVTRALVEAQRFCSK